MLALILGLLFSLPIPTQADTIPQASDVVLIYENADLEQQGKYNFLYTVEGDDAIYTCEANRCSMIPIRDKGTVNLTVYKLPEGFPRVHTVVDPAKLEEYKNQAEKQYTLPNITTNQAASGDSRPYQKVNLYADGTFTIENANYSKPEINVPKNGETTEQKSLSGWKLFTLIGGAIVLLAVGIVGWRYYQARQLQI